MQRRKTLRNDALESTVRSRTGLQIARLCMSCARQFSAACMECASVRFVRAICARAVAAAD
eukprot:4896776-Lingulodinium_polyedra.AAC.1